MVGRFVVIKEVYLVCLRVFAVERRKKKYVGKKKVGCIKGFKYPRMNKASHISSTLHYS